MKLSDINSENIKKIYDKALGIAKKEVADLSVIDTIVAAAIVFVLLLVICSLLSSMMKNKLPWNSRIGYSLAGAYGIFMIELAIFSREADSRDGIFNFSMFSSTLNDTEKIYIFLNVMFLVPFGIVLAEGMYNQFRFIKTLLLTTLASGLFSLAIETIQRATGRGYFELADLQANTLGGAIGAVPGAIIGAIFYSHSHHKSKAVKKKKK